MNINKQNIGIFLIILVLFIICILIYLTRKKSPAAKPVISTTSPGIKEKSNLPLDQKNTKAFLKTPSKEKINDTNLNSDIISENISNSDEVFILKRNPNISVKENIKTDQTTVNSPRSYGNNLPIVKKTGSPITINQLNKNDAFEKNDKSIKTDSFLDKENTLISQPQANSLLSRYMTFEKPLCHEDSKNKKKTLEVIYKTPYEDKEWKNISEPNEYTLMEYLRAELDRNMSKLTSFSLFKSFICKTVEHYRSKNKISQIPSLPPLEKNIKEPFFYERISVEHPILFAYLNMVKTNCRYRKFLLDTNDGNEKKLLESLLENDCEKSNIKISDIDAEKIMKIISDYNKNELQYLFFGNYAFDIDQIKDRQTFEKVKSSMKQEVSMIEDYNMDDPNMIIHVSSDKSVEANLQDMLWGIKEKGEIGKEKFIVPIFLNAPSFLTFSFVKKQSEEKSLTFQQTLSLFSLENGESNYSLTGFVITEKTKSYGPDIINSFFKHDGVWKWFDNGKIIGETELKNLDFNFKTSSEKNTSFEVELFYSRDE
ncbi:hypothetical protein CDIK_2636 [Cucumispora dikerogammari]|nr:hypothetical protein CDIK_2636 [Cucumispora dikerogammari]